MPNEKLKYENFEIHKCVNLVNGTDICCNFSSEQKPENELQKFRNSSQRKKNKYSKPLVPHPEKKTFYTRTKVNKDEIFKQICQKNPYGNEDYIIQEIPVAQGQTKVLHAPPVTDILNLPTKSELSYKNDLFRESHYDPENAQIWHYVKRRSRNEKAPSVKTDDQSDVVLGFNKEPLNMCYQQDMVRWFNQHGVNEATIEYKNPTNENDIRHRKVKRIFDNNFKESNYRIKNKKNLFKNNTCQHPTMKIITSRSKPSKRNLRKNQNEFISISSEDDKENEQKDFSSEENDFESQENGSNTNENSYINEDTTQNSDFSDHQSFKSVSESDY